MSRARVAIEPPALPEEPQPKPPGPLRSITRRSTHAIEQPIEAFHQQLLEAGIKNIGSIAFPSSDRPPSKWARIRKLEAASDGARNLVRELRKAWRLPPYAGIGGSNPRERLADMYCIHLRHHTPGPCRAAGQAARAHQRDRRRQVARARLEARVGRDARPAWRCAHHGRVDGDGRHQQLQTVCGGTYAVVSVCLYGRFTSVLQMLEGVGLLYVMLFQMVTDVMQWIKLTGFFTLGLGVAFTALMPGSTTGDNHPFARALWLLVGDFDPEAWQEYFPEWGIQYDLYLLGMVILWVSVFVMTVVLVNLLIAQMSSTYERLKEEKEEIWQAGRVKLIREYKDSFDPIPAPLNLLFIVYAAFMPRSPPSGPSPAPAAIALSTASLTASTTHTGTSCPRCSSAACARRSRGRPAPTRPRSSRASASPCRPRRRGRPTRSPAWRGAATCATRRASSSTASPTGSRSCTRRRSRCAACSSRSAPRSTRSSPRSRRPSSRARPLGRRRPPTTRGRWRCRRPGPAA